MSILRFLIQVSERVNLSLLNNRLGEGGSCTGMWGYISIVFSWGTFNGEIGSGISNFHLTT